MHSPIDLSTNVGEIELFADETVECLEKPNPIAYKKWRRSRLWGLAIGGVLILVGAILFLYVVPAGGNSFDRSLQKLERGSSTQGGRISNAAEGVQSGLGMMVILCLTGAVPLFGSIVLLASGVKLLIGPPKAEKSPEKSVRKFFGKVLYLPDLQDELMSGSPKSAKIEAFSFLLNRAKREFGGVEGFLRYWDKVQLDLIADLMSRPDLVNSGMGIDTLGIAINEIQIHSTDAIRADYKAVLHCNAKLSDRAPNPSYKYGEAHPFIVTGALERVGDRWYFTNGIWKVEQVVAPNGP